MAALSAVQISDLSDGGEGILVNVLWHEKRFLVNVKADILEPRSHE
jgi:hypothetical protein